jgi:hypothetical protein
MEMKTVVEKIEGSVSVNPTVRNEFDDANLMSVHSIAPLDDQKGDLTEQEELKGKEEKAEGEGEELKEKEPAPKAEAEPLVKKEKDPVQKRIDELTKKRREAERQVEFERSKRLELEAELKKVKASVPATDKPKAGDFETEADFVEALTDWKIEQRIRTEMEKATKVVKEREEKKAIDDTYSDLDETMDRGHEKYEDFDEVVLNKDLVLTDTMTEAVLFSDKADDILYFLGKHPEISESISKLPPLRIAQELGKIEERLGKPATPPPKKTTKAPAPLTPLKTTGVVDKDPSQMTPKEYRAWRERNKE